MENKSTGSGKRRRWPKIVIIVQLLALIGAVAMVVAMLRQISSAKGMFQSVMHNMAIRCEEKNLLPENQMIVLQDLSEITSHKDMSIWGVLLCAGITIDALFDEMISEEELSNLTLVRDFAMEQDGDVGFADVGKFFQDNPCIEEIFKSMRSKYRKPAGVVL